MSFKYWIIVYALIIGCVGVEIGSFLKKLDENLSMKLANSQDYNSTQFFKDLAAYSFNARRLLRLFKLKRDHVMEAAKWLHAQGPPKFLRNFSCERVKELFKLNEKDENDVSRFIEMINHTLRGFSKACEENPQFIGIPLEKPDFTLERLLTNLELMFKSPQPEFTKYKLMKKVEEFHYLLGKFTKKFVLGRRAVMNRARALFESGGPAFLKHYDYFKLQKDYSLTVTEAASLDSYIRRVQKRYDQFTQACYDNPNFESKIDLSSIKIVQDCEKGLKTVLQFPSPALATQLFKHLRDYYHVLGFLRRHSIPHRSEILRGLFEFFGTNIPQVLDPQTIDKMKKDFGLDEITGKTLEEYINHLGRRFSQVQASYLQINGTQPKPIREWQNKEST